MSDRDTQKGRTSAIEANAPLGAILDRLYDVVESRKGAQPQESYTAALYAAGTEKIAGKLAEETAEAICEAVKDDPAALARESADLLFHLVVLWAHKGMRPDAVCAVLESRFGTGGHEEKESRAAPEQAGHAQEEAK